jgi:hypothetical protein
MLRLVALLALGACGFEVHGAVADGPRDAPSADAPSADAPPVDAPVCANDCGAGTCTVTVPPDTAWQVTTDDGATWTDVALPDTGWPCDHCTRRYRTSTCGVPTDVTFQFASDNQARLWVNGAVAFDQYWIVGYCTDQGCCAKCCDSPSHCTSSRSAPISLDAAALGLFTPGLNTLEWEVTDETGGAGFYTETTLTY